MVTQHNQSPAKAGTGEARPRNLLPEQWFWAKPTESLQCSAQSALICSELSERLEFSHDHPCRSHSHYHHVYTLSSKMAGNPTPSWYLRFWTDLELLISPNTYTASFSLKFSQLKKNSVNYMKTHTKNLADGYPGLSQSLRSCENE